MLIPYSILQIERIFFCLLKYSEFYKTLKSSRSKSHFGNYCTLLFLLIDLFFLLMNYDMLLSFEIDILFFSCAL